MSLVKECLIEELKKLKESSKEAVENLDSFSEFKEYMHVKRKVQDELYELIEKSSKSNKSQLILVCGGVGDGKSHLISYFKNKYSGLMNKFILHNDATESLDPEKTSIDTLNDVLQNFSDEKLNNGVTEKCILAINLGTLNNFIDSEYGSNYMKLKQYVADEKILETNITENYFAEESSFQFINFSDYHMYTLTNEGGRSQYIKDIINKIIGENDKNPFHISYKEKCCNICEQNERCPVKYNYELLMNEQTQNKIIDLLVEVTIKEKIIISTRALLNFMYDIIVDSRFDNITLLKIKNRLRKLNFKEYLECMMPNIIFDHKDLSKILEALKNVDPINLRDEAMDAIIIKLNNTTNLFNIFNDNIDIKDNEYLKSALTNEFIKEEKLDTVREKDALRINMIKYFLRLYSFKSIDKSNSFRDELYFDFIKNLYYWNNGNKNELKKTLLDVKDAIYKWNGNNNDKEKINLVIGKNQGKYKISQKLNIIGSIKNYVEKNDPEIFKFIPELILEFKNKNNSNRVEKIEIDYSLYKLLMNIKNGYRPNKTDKNNYINFVEFMNNIILLGSQNEELLFEYNIAGMTKKYKLEFDDYGEYCFME